MSILYTHRRREEEEEEEEKRRRKEKRKANVWNVWNFCMEYLVGIVYNMYGIHVWVRNFSNQIFCLYVC